MVVQAGPALKHRGANAQPGGRLASEGVDPGTCGSLRSRLVLGRHGGEEPRGVRMARRCDHVRCRTALDHAARIHDADVVGEARDHRQIVRHPHEGRAGLIRQAAHLGEDLALDRDVERRGRLVGDDDGGAVQKGDGDRHALAHAAGELMRIGVEPLLRAWNADLGESIARACPGDFPRDPAVRPHRRDHLRPDLEDRVERHHRVLEDHGDLSAADLAHGLALQAGEILAVEEHLAARDLAGRLDQAEDRIAGHALAGAGLADESQDAAASDLEADAVDGLQNAGPGLELRLEILDAKNCFAHRLRLGFRTLRTWSPTRLIATTISIRAMPG